MKVSVLTITNRPGGIDIAVANLERQTVRDFEWVLVDSLYAERSQPSPTGFGMEHFAPDVPFQHLPDPPKSRVSNMAAAVNHGLAHCRGEYVVLMQDYIWIPPKGIERFLKGQREHGPCLVTGVGNVGSGPRDHDPTEMFSIFGDWYDLAPTGLSWADPRKSHLHGVHPCEPVAWEANWACLPLAVAEELGGFDEEYDNGWAWDHVEFAERARLSGYPILIDMNNECKAFPHDTYFPNPLKANHELSNGTRCARDIEALRKGERPLKTPHLAARKEAICLPLGL